MPLVADGEKTSGSHRQSCRSSCGFCNSYCSGQTKLVSSRSSLTTLPTEPMRSHLQFHCFDRLNGRAPCQSGQIAWQKTTTPRITCRLSCRHDQPFSARPLHENLRDASSERTSRGASCLTEQDYPQSNQQVCTKTTIIFQFRTMLWQRSQQKIFQFHRQYATTRLTHHLCLSLCPLCPQPCHKWFSKLPAMEVKWSQLGE